MIWCESNFAILSTSSSLCTKPYERLTEFKVPKSQSLSRFEKDYETNKVSSRGLSPIAHGPVSHILSLYPDEVFEPPKPLIRELIILILLLIITIVVVVVVASRFKWRISDCQRGLTVLSRNLDIFLCKQEDSVCLQSEDLDLVLTSYLCTYFGCRSCQGLNLSSICRTLFLIQSPQQSMRWWYRKKGKSVRLSCLFIFVDSLFHVLFCLFLFEQTAPSPSLKMKKIEHVQG